MGVRNLAWLLIVSSFILLSSCKSTPVVEAPKPQPVVTAEPPKEELPTLSPAEKARVNLEQKLLAEAETAYRAGRLIEPSHDNAYDRFQSVLLLNPNNNLARAGVQAILLSYAEKIRNTMKMGHVTSAQNLLRTAELYYPANSLLMDLKKDIASARAREEEVLLANEPENNTRVDYPLPTGALSRKSSTITAYLKRIAERLQETDETVLIYARNDAEGRWIYSQLNKSVTGYRVRGDIRIAGSPKISILPPLQ